MPPGLVELMEGLAKDVLKCNPPDVYAFCANHMKKLIEIRDGPTPTRVFSLEQKITIATKKMRDREARRREDYDKNMRIYKESESQHNEVRENGDNCKNKSDARQYVKDKIVKIPEEDLNGNKEHEIVVNVKEKSLESVKPTKLETETEIKPVDSLLATSEDSNKTNVEDEPPVNIVENVESFEALEINSNKNEEKVVEINQTTDPNHEDAFLGPDDKLENGDETNVSKKGESEINEKADSLPSFEKNCVESVTEIINNSESQNSTGELTKHEDYLKCEKNNIPENEANTEKKDDFSTNTGISHVSIVVDEPKDLNNFAEEDNAVIDINTEETHDDIMDQSTLYSSIIMEEESDKDQLKSTSNFFQVLQDNTTPTLTEKQHEIQNPNNSEIQNSGNNTTMNLETAAITIQKVFRNFLFKNKTLSSDDVTNVDINALIEDKNEKGDSNMSSTSVNKDRRTLGLSRMDTVLQTVNEEKSLSQSTDDSSTLSSAATVIQAHVRGYLVRNKLNVNKNSSTTTSGVDSDGLSFTSIEGDNEQKKSKTILNIHIVPESGHFMSRDESVLTSIDLSMDGSPPSSTNLHPLGYDRSQRRKQLKREDAFQSTSPPSNNSGKLSEDVDSVKEVLIHNDNKEENQAEVGNTRPDLETMHYDDFNISTLVDKLDTALEVKSLGPFDSPVKHETDRPHSLPELNSDEMDVITPFSSSDIDSHLIHSSEFHDVVLPTKVTRSDTSVVREFHNVLVYFLLWNNA